MFKKSICSSMFLLLFAITICFAEDGKGKISGEWITKEHGPMTGGQVLLFNAENRSAPGKDSNSVLRPPDFGVKINENGKFSAEVPAGNYYLIMRKRVNPERAGQTEEGDPWYYARNKNGSPIIFTINPGKETSIGTITEMAPFKKEKLISREGLTGIEGTVSDEQGQPVAGVRVFAYDSPGMQGRPLFASDKTDEKGKYFINTDLKGTFYLKVRTHLGGGRPISGEFMGTYVKPGTQDSVVVEKGKIRKEIDIVVSKFVDRRKIN